MQGSVQGRKGRRMGQRKRRESDSHIAEQLFVVYFDRLYSDKVSGGLTHNTPCLGAKPLKLVVHFRTGAGVIFLNILRHCANFEGSLQCQYRVAFALISTDVSGPQQSTSI